MPEYAGEISLKASIEKKEFYASLLEMKNKLGELTKYSKPIKLSINFKKLNLSNIDSAIQDITQKYNNLVKGLEKPPEEIGIAKAFRKAESDLAKLISKRDSLVRSIGGENNLEIVDRGVKQGRVDESTLPAEYSKIKDLEIEIEKSKDIVRDLAETLNAVRLNPELLPSIKNLQSDIDNLEQKKIQLINQDQLDKFVELKKVAEDLRQEKIDFINKETFYKIKELREIVNELSRKKIDLLSPENLSKLDMLKKSVSELSNKKINIISQDNLYRIEAIKKAVNDLEKKKITLIKDREIAKINELKKSISSAFDNMASKAKGGIGRVGNIIKSGFRKALSPLRALASGVSNLFKRIVRLGLLVTVFAALRHGFSSLRQYIGGALKTNTEFMNSLNKIRSNLLTAFYPIYQAILPALNSFMAMLSKATSYLAGFVSVIFGKNIKQSQAGAKALNDSIAKVNETTIKSTAVSNKKAKAVKNEKKAYDELGKGIKGTKAELAAFDKLNVLEKRKKNESQDIDNSAPDTPDVKVPVFTPTIEFSDSEMSKFETILEKIKNIFGKIRETVQPTIDAFKSLGETFKETFGKFAIRLGQDFLNEFLYPLGRWTFTKALPKFAEITENMLKNIDWEKLNNSLKGLFKAIEPFAEKVGDGLLWFYEKVLAPLGTYIVNNLLPPFIDELAADIKIMSTVLDGISDTFKWFFETALEKLKEAKVPDKLKEFFETRAAFFESIADNKDALLEVGQFIGAVLIPAIIALTVALAAKGLLGAIAAIGALITPGGLIVAGLAAVAGGVVYFAKKASESGKVYKKFYQDMGTSEEEFSKLSAEEKSKMLSTWLNSQKEFADDNERINYEQYKNLLERDQEMYENLAKHEREVAEEAQKDRERWNAFWGWFGTQFNSFVSKWSEFWGWFGDKLKEWGENLKNWGQDAGKAIAEGAQKAWNKVGDIGKTVWNNVLKWIQDKINKFIEGINWVIDKVKLLPGTDFLQRIPEVKIPGLAQGAVLKGGSPMLAYLNDQPRGQINIETPLNTMIDAFNTALQNNSYAGNITIEANGDIDSIVSLLNFRIKKENSRIGTRLISGDAWI